MFKKMIIVIMAMVMAMSMIACAKADAAEVIPETMPGIIGVEHMDEMIEMDKRYDNGETIYHYTITMINSEGYWVVFLEGETDAYWNQGAMGIYEHMPTEDEIKTLWNNRVDCDVITDTIEEFETQKERP